MKGLPWKWFHHYSSECWIPICNSCTQPHCHRWRHLDESHEIHFWAAAVRRETTGSLYIIISTPILTHFHPYWTDASQKFTIIYVQLCIRWLFMFIFHRLVWSVWLVGLSILWKRANSQKLTMNCSANDIMMNTQTPYNLMNRFNTFHLFLCIA